ncbi:MAG: hypothetical protein ACPGO3_16095 [Magnetospiraceae bacterium]
MRAKIERIGDGKPRSLIKFRRLFRNRYFGPVTFFFIATLLFSEIWALVFDFWIALGLNPFLWLWHGVFTAKAVVRTDSAVMRNTATIGITLLVILMWLAAFAISFELVGKVLAE